MSRSPKPKIYKTSEIKSLLLQPALTSHYIVDVSPPKEVQDFIDYEGRFDGRYLTAMSVINLACCDASLPGSTLYTTDVTNDYTGVTEKIAYRRQYDDRADFTFYVNTNYDAIELFEGWMNYISDENPTRATDAKSKAKNYSDITTRYRFNFPINYRTSIFITKFERNSGSGEKDQKKMEYEFIGAYPISITSIPLSYEASQLLKCTVSFTYIRHVKGITIGNTTTPIDQQENVGLNDLPSIG